MEIRSLLCRVGPAKREGRGLGAWGKEQGAGGRRIADTGPRRVRADGEPVNFFDGVKCPDYLAY